MKANRKKSGILAAGRLLAVLLTVTAAALIYLLLVPEETDSFLKAYKPEDQAANISRSFQIDTQLFASDLCVVMDQTPPAEPLDAGAALIFNITDGTAVYNQNAFDRLYPASITKVMTYLVAANRVGWDETVTITDVMLDLDPKSSVAGLKAGDIIAVKDLFYGLLMASGNDAAQAIALHVCGTQEEFAGLMNETAKALGATGSHFVNAHGLTDEQHYTTAYDIYLIFKEALKDARFVEILSTLQHTAYYTGAGGSQVEKTWSAGQLYAAGEATAPEGFTVVGGKTGTTSAARNCMVLYSRDSAGKEYVSVVLKAPGRDVIYEDLNALFLKSMN